MMEYYAATKKNEFLITQQMNLKIMSMRKKTTQKKKKILCDSFYITFKEMQTNI